MRYILIIMVVAFFWGCDKYVQADQILKNLKFSQTTVPADGLSIVIVTVELDDNASTDRRNVVFTTSSGLFKNNNSAKSTVAALYISGRLTATDTLVAPSVPGEIIVEVQPEFNSSLGDFVVKGSITATKSVLANITINPSSYGIGANYANDVLIEAFLTNADGNPVSAGYTVSFNDFLLNGDPAGGQFSNQQATTTDSGKVSASYSTGNQPLLTPIKIIVTEKDTGKSKFIILTVNK